MAERRRRNGIHRGDTERSKPPIRSQGRTEVCVPPERRRKRGRHSPRKWMFASLFVLILAALLIFLMNAPFFEISLVRVEGNELVSQEEILDAAGEIDGNLFRFPISRMEERISQISGIEEVKGKRDLPNCIVIQIKESYVLAKLVNADRTYYLSNDGRVTETYHEDTNRIEPLEIEIEDSHPVYHQPLFEDPRPLEFLQLFRKTALAEGVTKVRFDQAQNINIMYNHLIVRFGPPNDILSKLSDLLAVLDEVKKNGVKAQEIILNEGDNPIVVTEQAR